MPRSPRELHAGFAYHLYNRGAEKARVFRRREQYELFLSSFGRTKPSSLSVLYLCLMPNHWHQVVLIREDPDSLSSWLQQALTRFSRGYRARWGGAGPLWQGRTGIRPIADEQDLSGVMRYLERNPLEAEIVHRPEDWPWSSANAALRARHPWIADTLYGRP